MVDFKVNFYKHIQFRLPYVLLLFGTRESERQTTCAQRRLREIERGREIEIDRQREIDKGGHTQKLP